jgi:hypothetical protein
LLVITLENVAKKPGIETLSASGACEINRDPKQGSKTEADLEGTGRKLCKKIERFLLFRV